MSATGDEPRGLRRWFGHLLDLLYPPSCALCHTPLSLGRSVCTPCTAGLPRLAEPYCTTCGEHFDGVIEGPFSCPNCRNLKFAFEFARPALMFDERAMSLVHELKYRKGIHLARCLGTLAAESFADPRLAGPLAEGWPLVPVPLHPRRRRERHFNQAEEIARTVSRLTDLPVVPALRRVRSTGTQTRLTRAQRLQNLSGAFAVTRAGLRFSATKPPGAILLDDVFTTGATVNECARVLRRAGVQKVVVVTLLRG